MIDPVLPILVGFFNAQLADSVASNCVYDVLKVGVQRSGGALGEQIKRAYANQQLPTNHTIERGVRRAAFSATLILLEPIDPNELASIAARSNETPHEKEQRLHRIDKNFRNTIKLFRKFRNLYSHQQWESEKTQAKLIALTNKSFATSVEPASDNTLSSDTYAHEALALVSGGGDAANLDSLSTLFLHIALENLQLSYNETQHLKTHISPQFIGDAANWPDYFTLCFAQELKDDPALHSILVHQKLAWNESAIADLKQNTNNLHTQAQKHADTLIETLSANNQSIKQILDTQSNIDVTLADILQSHRLLDGPGRAVFESMFRDPANTVQKNDLNTIDRFHFSQRGDEFLGRRDELKAIENQFLSLPSQIHEPEDMFGWMAICGEAGAGKSRLAQELIARNKGIYRLSGFASEELIKTEHFGRTHQERIAHPLLIVVDYTAGHQDDLPSFLKSWADYARHGLLAPAERRFPVRIVLLVRRPDDRVFELIRNKGGNAADSLLASGERFGLGQQMVLDNLARDETLNLMRARIDKTAQEHKETAIESSNQDLLEALNKFDSLRRPLFAAMVAHALQRGTLPGINTTAHEEDARLELFASYLNGQWQSYWCESAQLATLAESSNAIEEVVVSHANLMRVCTAAGGLDRDSLDEFLTRLENENSRIADCFPIAGLRSRDNREIVYDNLLLTMAGGRGSYNGAFLDPVPPLEPDLIGERFVVMNTDECSSVSRLWCNPTDIVRLAWDLNPQNTANFLRLATLDYAKRLHQNNWFKVNLTDVQSAKARARLLGNICDDTAHNGIERSISFDEMARLFDLVDLFEDELGGFIETEPYVLSAYAHLLKKVSNVASSILNKNLKINEDNFEESIESLNKLESTVRSRFSKFASLTLDNNVSAKIDAPSQELINLIIEKLPTFRKKVQPRIFVEDDPSTQEAFCASLGYILSCEFWKYRNNSVKGGYWPTAPDSNDIQVVSTLHQQLLIQLQSSSSGVHISMLCSLIRTTIYTEVEPPEDYLNSIDQIVSGINQITDMDCANASVVLALIRNLAICIIREGTKYEKNQIATHLQSLESSFGRVLKMVDLTDATVSKRRVFIDSSINLWWTRVFAENQFKVTIEHKQDEAILDILRNNKDDLLLTATLLSSATSILSHAKPDIAELTDSQKTLKDLLTFLIDADCLEPEGFLTPSFEQFSFLLAYWIFRRNGGIFDSCYSVRLLDQLDSKLPAKTKSELIDTLPSMTSSALPIMKALDLSIASDYIDHLLETDEYNEKHQLAILSIWYIQMLTGHTDSVMDAVFKKLENTDSKNIETLFSQVIGFRGITLLASGLVSHQVLHERFHTVLSTYEAIKIEAMEGLYLEGRNRSAVGTLTRDYNRSRQVANYMLNNLQSIENGQRNKTVRPTDGQPPTDSTSIIDNTMARKYYAHLKAATEEKDASQYFHVLHCIHARTPIIQLLHLSQEMMAKYAPQKTSVSANTDPQTRPENQPNSKDVNNKVNQPTGKNLLAKKASQLYPLSDDLPDLADHLISIRADATWPFLPAFEANWQTLDSASAELVGKRFHAALNQTLPDINSLTIVSVRSAALTCYAGFDAVELLLHSQEGLVCSSVCLISPTCLLHIDGTSPGIHNLNAGGANWVNNERDDSKGALDVSTQAKAAEYLRFFCGCVHGEEGAFSTIENEQQLRNKLHPDTDVSEYLDQLHLIELTRKESPSSDKGATPSGITPGWDLTTCILYSNALFIGNFSLSSSGMLALVEDTPIATELKPLLDGIVNGLRMVDQK